MAMSVGGLKSRLVSNLTAGLNALYENPADDHRLTGYTLADYIDRLAQAIATSVYNEIITNARAQGTDTPNGDTHDLNIV